MESVSLQSILASAFVSALISGWFLLKSKKEDLFLVFKDYLNADFFFQRFDIKNYNNLNEILWKYVSSIE